MAMFPNQVGVYPHGTIEKGYERLVKEKEDPLNTDRVSREILNELEILYHSATSKFDDLHPGRRFLSKSGESRETGGGSEHPDRSVLEIAQKIFSLEISFENHKIARAPKAESVDSNLLKAIEIANQAMLINSMGDYWGALCQEFRDNKHFQKPSKQAGGSWAFLGFSKYSDLIQEYDEQKASLEAYNQLPAAIKNDANNKRPDTRLIGSLDEAALYLKGQYESVDEIISFMRQYANRNMTVHPVETYFEQGNSFGLRKKILRDYGNFSFLGSDELSEAYKTEVKTTLEILVKRFYLQWSWDKDGFAMEGPALAEYRRIFEDKMKRQSPFTERRDLMTILKARERKTKRRREKALKREITLGRRVWKRKA